MKCGYLLLLLATAEVGILAANGGTLQLVPLSFETADSEFYATLGIGTPAKPFRLVVDTGSANLWVPSSSCTSLACTQRAQYNPKQSSTSQIVGTVVPISYGGGAISSTLVNDVVSLPETGSSSSSGSKFVAGLSFKQTIGMATSIEISNASSTAQQPWDGLLGMGRLQLTAGDVNVPVLSMYSQGLISRPMFALYLLRNSSAPGAGGEMALGGWNQDRVQGDVAWVDVILPQLAVQQGYWSVPVNKVGLQWPNGSSTSPQGACAGFAAGSSSNSGGSSSLPGCIGLLDSGTATIIGSIDQVAALNAALGGVPSIQELPFDCSRQVSTVLQATAQALSSSSSPSAAANEVCSTLYPGTDATSSLESILCSAVQLELFEQWKQQPTGIISASMLAAVQQQSIGLCRQLPYAQKVTVDCNSIASMPNISFTIGTSEFSLPVQEYAYQSRKDLRCYSKITAIGALGPGTWVLGQPFMRNVYTVFDYGVAAAPAAAAAGGPQASSGDGSGTSTPRVGIGQLTAAEKAAAAELFDQALASKRSKSQAASDGGLMGAATWRLWLGALAAGWLLAIL